MNEPRTFEAAMVDLGDRIREVLLEFDDDWDQGVVTNFVVVAEMSTLEQGTWLAMRAADAHGMRPSTWTTRGMLHEGIALLDRPSPEADEE